MRISNILLPIVVLTALVSSAMAGDIVVPQGKRWVVGAYGVYYPNNCSGGPVPEVAILQQPAHGKFTIVDGDVPMDKIRLSCTGQKYHAKMIVYTPAAHYLGPDSGRVHVAYSRVQTGATTSDNDYPISIIVK